MCHLGSPCVCVCVCVCVYICVCVCMYLCMYTYIYVTHLCTKYVKYILGVDSPVLVKYSCSPVNIMLLLLLSCFSCVQLCATPYTAAHQALPSLGFSRQEHWSGLPFPSPINIMRDPLRKNHPAELLSKSRIIEMI